MGIKNGEGRIVTPNPDIIWSILACTTTATTGAATAGAGGGRTRCTDDRNADDFHVIYIVMVQTQCLHYCTQMSCI